MKTTVATAIAVGQASQVAESLVKDVRKGLGDQAPALVIAFTSTQQPLEAVARVATDAFPTAVVLGSTTSGEFTEQRDTKGGATLFALAGDYKVFAGMGPGLKTNPEASVTQALDGLPRSVHGYPHRTAVMLLDLWCRRGGDAYSPRCWDKVALAGGAAGDDLAMKATHVSLGRRVATDATIIALVHSKAPLGVGVCHGHNPISRPLRVTRANANVVYEVEGRPAWEVARPDEGARRSERCRESFAGRRGSVPLALRGGSRRRQRVQDPGAPVARGRRLAELRMRHSAGCRHPHHRERARESP